MADGSKFCTSCGKQQSSQPAEQAVLVFPAIRKYSLFKMDTCNIVFMRDRLVLAYLTGDKQKMESAKVAADIKAQGLGFFKGSAYMMRYWADYSKKYYTMDINSILAEDPLNQVIHYSMIMELKYRCYESGDSDSNSTGGELNLMIINGEPLKFTHTEPGDKQIKSILSSLLGYRLKYK
jgi:hypothetical protein